MAALHAFFFNNASNIFHVVIAINNHEHFVNYKKYTIMNKVIALVKRTNESTLTSISQCDIQPSCFILAHNPGLVEEERSQNSKSHSDGRAIIKCNIKYYWR